MLVKSIIAIFLIAGSLALDSKERFEYENRELPENKEFHVSQKKEFEKNEKWYGKKYKNEDPEQQFQKDYNHWNDKKYLKHASDERKKSSFMEINEIDSNEFIDKFNKYGNTFNPNLINLRKEKTTYHDESKLGKEKHEKPGTLIHDTNVNYINNNKKISGDSELITENSVSGFKNKENYQENYQNVKEVNMKRYKKDFYQNLKKIDLSIPPRNDSVMMARYIVHTVDWAALGTLSGRAPTKGAPFTCVKATSDGLENASSGIPFFYMSPNDLCTQDLQKDNRVSVLVTLSETEYCKKENLDPQDPRCAKLTLSGKIKRIKPGSDEEKFAKNALFTRHPEMTTWPSDHKWYFTKLKIGQIILLDNFGGATYIKVKDYLNGGVVEPQL